MPFLMKRHLKVSDWMVLSQLELLEHLRLLTSGIHISIPVECYTDKMTFPALGTLSSNGRQRVTPSLCSLHAQGIIL